MSSKSANKIYQLKITLKGSRPPIWRRIQIAADTKLSKLHDILQIVMGWQNCHLHQFDIYGEIYSEPNPDDWEPVLDENKVKLNRLIRQEKEWFLYEYDFGDYWEHIIVVEKILPADESVRYPVCIKGKRCCPPEDCGGIYGYEEFLKAVRDPENPEHEEMLEWAGEDIDPERFVPEEVNLRLKMMR